MGGGTYSKLFRNQGYSAADLLTREALQNSWDASFFLQGDDSVLFEFHLHFKELTGAAFDAFAEAAGLNGLLERRRLISEAGEYPAIESLERAFATKSLRVLQVSDFGSLGLQGHPRLKFNSRLYRAMYTLGSTKKDGSSHGQGGSFGFGKSALISASEWRTVIAHTRFRPSENDPAEERLVGWTYWAEHEVDGKNFEGRSILGLSTSESRLPQPYQDESAQAIAKQLGLPARTRDADDLGTTFVLLEPLVQPMDVLNSLERYWWPAIEDHLMSISVIDYQGNEHVPQPSTNSSLAPFVQAYELASGVRDPVDPTREVVPSSRWKKFLGERQGSLALVLDSKQGAHSADREEGLGDWRSPTVALIRRPRMVIEYKDFPSPHPIRGVFIADDAVDEYLRAVEPPLHNSWSSLSEESVSADALAMAKSINKKIRDAVKAFARQFTPVAPLRDDSFHLFGDLLGSVLSGNTPGGTGPAPGKKGSHVSCTISSLGKVMRQRVDGAKFQLEQEFVATIPKSLPASVSFLTIQARATICEDLEGTQGQELECFLIANKRESHELVIPREQLEKGSRSVPFSVVVTSVAQHHSVAIIPTVSITEEATR